LRQPASAAIPSALFGCFAGVGSGEARLVALALASARRTNCSCRFPASSFHDDATFQSQYPHCYDTGHLRTLQRRLKIWRRQAVQRLICDMDGLTGDLARNPSDRNDHNSRQG
jgi:hypothetical protein